jgi:hypothetical protein
MKTAHSGVRRYGGKPLSLIDSGVFIRQFAVPQPTANCPNLLRVSASHHCHSNTNPRVNHIILKRGLSGRAYNHILKISRSIANLDGYG